MSGPGFQLTGLLGFILSGLFFAVSSIHNQDPLALAGSLVWIVACLVWILPLLSFKAARGSKDKDQEVDHSED
jgi:hypothetical protein